MEGIAQAPVRPVSPAVVVPLARSPSVYDMIERRSSAVGTDTYRDPSWIGLLPLAVLAIIVATSVQDSGKVKDPYLIPAMANVAATSLGIVLAAAAITFIFALMFPNLFIRGIFLVGLLIGLSLIARETVAGIVIITIVVVFYMIARERIPFAVASIRLSSHVLARFPSALIVSGIGTCVVASMYMACTGILNSSFFWIVVGCVAQNYLVQVVMMVIHCTLSGVTASGFFLADSRSYITWLALKRSCTTSLGTIAWAAMAQCFLSLVNFVLIMIPFIGWCLRCMCGTASGAYRTYCLCYVAIYGSTMKEAASSATQLMKSSGVNAIVNDSLIDPVLNLITFVAAIVSFSVTATTIQGEFHLTAGWMALFLLASMFLTVMMATVALLPIRVAAATLLICWNDDPQAVRTNSRPEDYAKLVEAARARQPDLHARFLQ